MATVDMELKKHFEELQIQMAESKSKIRSMDSQIELLKKQSLNAKITRKEMSGLSQGVKTYESCGRMFILRPLPQVNDILEDKMKKADDKIKSLQGNQEYLEKSLKERENNLRDLVVQKQLQKSWINSIQFKLYIEL